MLGCLSVCLSVCVYASQSQYSTVQCRTSFQYIILCVVCAIVDLREFALLVHQFIRTPFGLLL